MFLFPQEHAIRVAVQERLWRSLLAAWGQAVTVQDHAIALWLRRLDETMPMSNPT